MQNFRNFSAGEDPFGRQWDAEFRWQQTGISIRHADTVDVKWELRSGEEVQEKVIALPHPALLSFCAATNQPLTDALCMKLAALHLKRMVTWWEDMDKTLVTIGEREMREHFDTLQGAPAA
jgi:hypothetical protein